MYHYTTKESYSQILRTGNLIPSTPWTAMDAYAGNGWYFTDLRPDTCDIRVSMACWLQEIIDRVAYFFEFDIDQSVYNHTRENVYMLAANLVSDGILKIHLNYTLNQKTVLKLTNHSKKNECVLKPCSRCSVAPLYRR